jgi:hypothetical protein
MGPCVVWLGEKTSKGYGRTKFGGKKHRVHRLMWELTNGPISPGLSVLHKCDNPSCFRLDHLFLGTDADNVRDCIAKGRHATARLTEDTVQEIRLATSRGFRQSVVAKWFGVDRTTVRDIVRRKTWRDA